MRPLRGALVLTILVLFVSIPGPGTNAGLFTSVPLVRAQNQASAGVVEGTVVDGNGNVVANATVVLVRPGASNRTTTTDSRGRFRFEGVESGVYEVVASRLEVRSSSIRIAVGDLPSPPVRLSLSTEAAGVAEEATTVSGQSPMAPPPVGTVEQGVVGGISGGSPAIPGVAGGAVGSNRGTGRGSGSGTGTGTGTGTGIERGTASGGGRTDRTVETFNREGYGSIAENVFRRVTDEPVSTFSIDVDTASYANVRRFLNDGRLPPPDAVRVEEMINYFDYAYPAPRGRTPVAITTELSPSPWNPHHALALVGLRARDISDETPRRNLVFLLDVSGSMQPPDKLPLVKQAMRMLTETLTASDRVAIVVYAGASGLALPTTSGDRKEEIDRAIRELRAGGSTNGASGIRLAYETAAASFVQGGVNRVILATDGDFNVGVTSQGDLVRLIEEERARGIFLSVLGVGTGNLQDATMELLADRGNGNYSYLDTLQEARRVLIDEANSTLIAVAKDVKIQVEFNPQTVAGYRLIGYENRLLARQDFNDDLKDAGEMGAGHTVTALYEVIPAGVGVPGANVDPLIYQRPARPRRPTRSDDLMTVKVRYKLPDEDESSLLSVAVRGDDQTSTENISFAAAVAQFGMLLRDSEFKGDLTWHSARTFARSLRGADPVGYRGELIRLLDLASALAAQQPRPSVTLH